jgi:hypothetical protein
MLSCPSSEALMCSWDSVFAITSDQGRQMEIKYHVGNFPSEKLHH